MIPRQKLGEDSARRQDQPGGSFVSDKALAVGWLPQKKPAASALPLTQDTGTLQTEPTDDKAQP